MLRKKRKSNSWELKVSYLSSLKTHLPHEETTDVDKTNSGSKDDAIFKVTWGQRVVCGQWQVVLIINQYVSALKIRKLTLGVAT